MDRNNVKGINKEIVDILDKYIAIVKQNYDVVAIILFGSYAKGTEHEDSDIDIAVVTDYCNYSCYGGVSPLVSLKYEVLPEIEA